VSEAKEFFDYNGKIKIRLINGAVDFVPHGGYFDHPYQVNMGDGFKIVDTDGCLVYPPCTKVLERLVDGEWI